MSVIPEAAVATQPASVYFRVSPELVARFAALTGDRSRLHVDEAFARRSLFRQRVVHGMLPVAFIPLLPPLQLEGFRCVLVRLSSRFIAPVYADTPLKVSAKPSRVATDGSKLEFDYEVEIAHEARQVIVTSGTATVTYDPIEASSGSKPSMSLHPQGAFLTGHSEVRHLLWEEIETGASDSLDFSISQAAVDEFVALLGAGVDVPFHESASKVAASFHVPNLLSILLYSTSLGVSLPGASATFLEFAAQVEGAVELDTPYRLRGRITHRSAATRIVRKELLVTPAHGEEVIVRGKASTLVAAPFRRMPSLEEIREVGTDFGLKDKVVLVTGASRGIGETTAKLFALHGARVIVNYRHGAEDAQRVVDEILDGGGQAIAVAADVSDAEQVRSLVRQACEQYGTIHVLVNNAARDFRPIPFSRLTWDEIQRDIDVIVKGAFLCCQETLPLMLERGEGKIINISTVAADNPPPDQMKYVIAKSALVGLTRSLSIELAARNVQVNLVVPNFVETDLVAHVPEGFRKKIAQDIPMRRPASSLDVARAVVFLASSYASFTTGQKVMVTGGGPPYL
jgi:3-oxoacyl-[acyl-carrier protein] reductase